MATTSAATKITVFALGVCALIALYSPQPLLLPIARWASVSASTAALTVSATTLGVAVMAPIAGAVSDRVGRKRVLLAGIIVLILATALIGTSGSFGVLLAYRVVQGMATPFVFAVAVAYVGEEFSADDSTRLNGIYVAGTAFGGFAGRLLPALSFDLTRRWQDSFWPIVVVLLIALVLVWQALPTERGLVRSPSFGASFAGIGSHLRDWRILATCLVGAALLFLQVGSFTFASLHLQASPLNLTTTQVGLAFVVFLVPAAVTPVAGILIQRVGRLPVFWASVGLGLAGLALTLVPAVETVIIGLALSSVSVFVGQVCATGFVAAHVGLRRSSAVGLYLTAYYLGGTLGGIVPAAPYSTDGWPAVVLCLAVATILGLSAGSVSWRVRRS